MGGPVELVQHVSTDQEADLWVDWVCRHHPVLGVQMTVLADGQIRVRAELDSSAGGGAAVAAAAGAELVDAEGFAYDAVLIADPAVDGGAELAERSAPSSASSDRVAHESAKNVALRRLGMAARVRRAAIDREDSALLDASALCSLRELAAELGTGSPTGVSRRVDRVRAERGIVAE